MEFIVSLVLLLGFLALFVWMAGIPVDRFWRYAYQVSLFALSVLVTLSLVSYHLGTHPNWAGIWGHWVAGRLVRVLGYGPAYALVLLGLILSVLGMGRPRRLYIRWVSGYLMVFFLLTLVPLWGYRGPWIGILPYQLSAWTRAFLGPYGGTVFLALWIMLFGLLAIPVERLKIPLRWPKLSKKKAPAQQRTQRPKVALKKKSVEKPEAPTPSSTQTSSTFSRTEESETSLTRGEQSDFWKEDTIPGGDALLPLLNEPVVESTVDEQECEENARLIEQKLQEFKATGRVVAYHPGPVVTRYEYEPDPGVKLSKVVNLADDLALRMKTSKVRIVAPLPDKGRIGIEIPNKKRRIVYFRELAGHPKFKELPSKLGFALGVDTAGHPVFADLTRMPHLLIAGATGSGKSVCINTIILSILFRAQPSDVRFILIDPKRIELSYYEGIPHLLLPVVKDREEAVEALQQVVRWMDLRYKHFAKDGVRDIENHNLNARKRKDTPIPYIVVVIDEFADLILSVGKKVEEPLARLAQMARAVGIHLVVATQRPSVDVITGLIKANFPVRIAFKVASRVDSRTILDEIGAEKLLGRGDMLFLPPGSSEPKRIHGPFVSEEETKRITRELTRTYLKKKLTDVFGPRPWDHVVEEILDGGYLSALTRSDEPGSEERLHRVATHILSRVLRIPTAEIVDGLEALREEYYEPIEEMIEAPIILGSEKGDEEAFVLPGEGWDPLVIEAARLAVTRRTLSATLLQRRFQIGFARAARILDQLERLEIVGPQEGAKPRKVLMTWEEFERRFRKRGESGE